METSPRVYSLDVFRGITVAAMILVGTLSILLFSTRIGTDARPLT